MSDSGDFRALPHVALLPSSGMGHLTPFLRLAASLAGRNCRVTLITTNPTVSLAESQFVSRFLSAFPQVTLKQFNPLPFDPTTANSNDPFFLRFESIRRSAHLLSPLLSSLSPPLSALIIDVTLISAVIPITQDLRIPNFILFTSSAIVLSFLAYFPTLVTDSPKIPDIIEIPGIPSIPKSWIPTFLLDQTNLFATQFIQNGQNLVKSNGILINSFDSLEPESMAALNNGGVVHGLPPVISFGPLIPCEFERGSPVPWLDDQPVGSVVYVSFGSRTAMSRAQIRELGEGLVGSGCRFVWVVKDKKVDKEDEDELGEVVGYGLIEKVKDRGLVVKGWVDQERILGHPAIGGFVSHCGWNSVTEAAWNGVRMLAWPQAGDQRMNAEVVERSGLGMWVRTWGWPQAGDQRINEEVVVKGEEIGEKVKEMMGNEVLRVQAASVREEARNAVAVGGTSEKGLNAVIDIWNHPYNVNQRAYIVNQRAPCVQGTPG